MHSKTALTYVSVVRLITLTQIIQCHNYRMALNWEGLIRVFDLYSDRGVKLTTDRPVLS
jgi:hypothetical protein